jgi:hypothetical protein
LSGDPSTEEDAKLDPTTERVKPGEMAVAYMTDSAGKCFAKAFNESQVPIVLRLVDHHPDGRAAT